MIHVTGLKLKDLNQAKHVFSMNYYKNGGNLLVKSVAPNLFNMRNIVIAKHFRHVSKHKVVGYLHFVSNVKLDKKDLIYNGYVWNNTNVYLAQTAILDEFKSHGIASQLLKYVLDNHCSGKDVYAHISVNNEKSKRLLSKFGFEVIGEFTPKGKYHGQENYKALIYHKYVD